MFHFVRILKDIYFSISNGLVVLEGDWVSRERKIRESGQINNQFQLTPMRAPRLIQKNSIVYIPLNYNLKRGKHI